MKLAAEHSGGPGAAGRIGPRLIVGVALLAAAIGGGVGLALHFLLKHSPALTAQNVTMRHGLYGDAMWAANAQPAPAIDTLNDQSGSRFALSSLHGHSVAIAFFDSHCHQECPLEGRQLAAAELKLPRSERPTLVVVSVNPQDTRSSVAKAVREWGLAGVAPWHWLMGTRKQLAPVWAAYHIYVSPRPIDGDINHTEALYLLDRKGDERAAYLWPFASRFATYDMRVLATRKAA